MIFPAINLHVYEENSINGWCRMVSDSAFFPSKGRCIDHKSLLSLLMITVHSQQFCIFWSAFQTGDQPPSKPFWIRRLAFVNSICICPNELDMHGSSSPTWVDVVAPGGPKSRLLLHHLHLPSGEQLWKLTMLFSWVNPRHFDWAMFKFASC